MQDVLYHPELRSQYKRAHKIDTCLFRTYMYSLHNHTPLKTTTYLSNDKMSTHFVAGEDVSMPIHATAPEFVVLDHLCVPTPNSAGEDVSPPSLRSMTGFGGLRTLTSIEEEEEAHKAAASRMSPPRTAWFWSERVEELYQKQITAVVVPMERSGNCTPGCNCETLGTPCGDWMEMPESPAPRTDPVYPEGPLSKEQLLERIKGCESLIAYSQEQANICFACARKEDTHGLPTSAAYMQQTGESHRRMAEEMQRKLEEYRAALE